MHRPWARFDDLRTGTALLCPPAKRVLTAVRPDEVADVLQEVHDATERGSWAFGYVAYEAAAGLDAQLPGGPAAPGEPPLVWFGLCDEPAPVDPVAVPADPFAGRAAWRPDWTDEEHARAVAAVREHIAAGDTYQCNLTDRLRTTVGGDPAGPLRAPGPRPARRLQRLPGPGPARRRQRQPRAVLRVGRRRGAHPPDEGDGAARPHDGGGRAADPPAAHQRQGARREPDDRRPAPQRPRPRRGRGQRAGGRALRPRALPDRLADDLPGQRADPARHRGCWTSSGRCSRADRSPALPSAAPCS